MQRHGDAAHFGGEHEEIDEHLADEEEREIPEPAALAHRVNERMMADAGEPSRHLGQEHDADGADEQHPQHLHAEGGAGERRRGNGADVEKAADARDNTEGEVGNVLHCGLATGGVFSAGTAAAAAWPARTAAPRSSCAAASCIVWTCAATASMGDAAASPPDLRALCASVCNDVFACVTTDSK